MRRLEVGWVGGCGYLGRCSVVCGPLGVVPRDGVRSLEARRLEERGGRGPRGVVPRCGGG